MAQVVWTDDLSVGVERLDEHHKRLFDLVNQLGQAIQAQDAKTTTGQVLGELVRYVYYHFGEEERLMHDAGYGGLNDHRKHHRAMADHVRQMEINYDRAPDTVAAAELYDFLADWLVNHIRSEDQMYRGYIS